MHSVTQESGSCDAWILENVVPTEILERDVVCSEAMSLVLGPAVPWCIFHENHTGSVIAKHRVVPRCITSGVNPVAE